LDPDLIEMRGCGADDVLQVTNPTNRRIGVIVVAEFFDSGGYSVGRIELGQRPATYTDIRRPGAR
jgi:hypothetical protein